MHAKGLLHRCVYVFAFDPQGRLWLQKRSLDRGLNPGRWTCTASGHVDAGEDDARAAVREAREEVGLDLEVRKVAEFRVREGRENESASLWEAHTEQRPRTSNEVMAVLCVDRAELAALRARLPEHFAPSFEAALKAYGWA